MTRHQYNRTNENSHSSVFFLVVAWLVADHQLDAEQAPWEDGEQNV
jgi:hypothetical protein